MTELRSFKNRLWEIPDPHPAEVRALVQAGTPADAAPVLAARGLSPDAAKRFCRISLAEELAATDRLRDLAQACERLAAAVRTGTRITVFGDYDVDGATATAIMVRALRHWGLAPAIYIPDRLSEGYGPNVPAIETIAAGGSELILFVDCGVAAHEPLERARALGLEVVVIDHHAVQGALPPAAAVVNPNRADDDSGLGHLCAAGLAWVVARATDLALSAEDDAHDRLDTDGLLDIAALGTVADVVPLTGLNRALVADGLRVMADTRWPGLAALIQGAGAEAPFSTYHLGFVLGPRINAGGRIGACDTGARLLATDDLTEAAELAGRLDAWNRERQAMEHDCKAEALASLADITPEGAVFACGDSWHEGVIGIVASRLKDTYDLPAFVLTRAEGGLLKGSARSMPGFDLGAAVIAAREAGLLEKGGGHAMAAGLSLRAEQLPAFQAFIRARIAESAFARTGAVTRIDARITPVQINRRFVEALETLAPFGVGASRPRFAIAGARLSDLRILEDKRTGQPTHLKLEVAGATGGRVKAIAFKIMGSPLADGLIAAFNAGTPVELAGTLKLNTFRGTTSAEIELEDARAMTAEAAIAA